MSSSPVMEVPADPRRVYEAAIRSRTAAAAVLRRREDAVSWLRLLVFAVTVIAVWFSLVRGSWPAWSGLVPAAIFVALVIAHGRITSARRRLERSAAFYQDGLRRIAKDFSHPGRTGARFLDPSHPYAEDLDLFGDASLFSLVSTARTDLGEERLASWLLEGATAQAVRERQSAVAELRPRLGLREDLSVQGEETVASIDPGSLRPLTTRVSFSVAARIGAFVLAVSNAITLLAWLGGWSGPAPFAVSAAAAIVFTRWLAPRVRRELEGVERSRGSLATLAMTVRRLERETFSSPLLSRLGSELTAGRGGAAQAIARLERILDLLDARRNQLFLPFAALFLWTTQMAFLVEAWKRAHGSRAQLWLDAVAELEALSSLASFAFEHPAYPFPEIREATAGEPKRGLFAATALGHPLIAEDRLVRNDVALGRDVPLLIVSGSNMSGKSTLLRSVGTNAVLALAGAPVCAEGLEISPLSLGASVTVHDSLLEGRSRFFAEISRLRRMIDLAQGPLPLIFLLDEILHGTNSHDRRIGAEAVLAGLLSRSAIGIVTTHDLALASIAGTLPARNVHFEDRIEGGAMVFDYRMREGVVTRSNALELMRSVGLEV